MSGLDEKGLAEAHAAYYEAQLVSGATLSVLNEGECVEAAILAYLSAVGQKDGTVEDEQAAVQFYAANPRAALFDFNARLAGRPALTPSPVLVELLRDEEMGWIATAHLFCDRLGIERKAEAKHICEALAALKAELDEARRTIALAREACPLVRRQDYFGTPLVALVEAQVSELFQWKSRAEDAEARLAAVVETRADGCPWTVYDWEYTDPKTGHWGYARTPERAEALMKQGIKLTPVYVPNEPFAAIRNLKDKP